MNHRRINVLTALCLSIMAALQVQADVVTFTGNARPVMTITPDKNSGLDAIYVLYGVQGVTVEAPPLNGVAAQAWYIYDNRGGGFATELDAVERDGAYTRLHNPQGDRGYIIEYPDKRVYFWITDYTEHVLRLEDITLPSESQCDMTTLKFQGNGDAIHYYSINGRQLVLSRELQLTYYTLEWNQDEIRYQQIQQSQTVESLEGEYFINPAPLCDTYFELKGDRFLSFWEEEQQVRSAYYTATAVAVMTTAERVGAEVDNSNQIHGQEGELGGSAPANISFKAYISDAVIHSEWQFASDMNFEDITHRFNQQDLDYEFREEGTVYVRFIGSNSDGSCEAYSDVYTVNIGASDLRCPNAFTPGSSPGVNDEWKVSYRSLLTFKCWIFDRYGTQLYYFDSPDGGWDGRYKGKLVRPGVYYYVIEAQGADGKKYKKAGDINILRYNSTDTSTGNGDAE